MNSDKKQSFAGWLRLLLVLAVCFIAGAQMYKCQSPPADIPGREECVIDTIVVFDTIVCYEPIPVSEKQIEQVVRLVPVHDTVFVENYAQKSGENIRDTVAVEIPITQKEYAGKDYHAWVSGFEPKLDSVFVYPRHETITIKQPPDRWHIGPTIGCGITSHGFEPYIGISIMYSIYSW